MSEAGPQDGSTVTDTGIGLPNIILENSLFYSNTTAFWNTTNNSTNGTNEFVYTYGGISMLSAFFVALYILICITGLLGNGLVIFVVLRYAKMKTVTNMYILNLAIADLCFLIGLPFLISTIILNHWVFGFVICKLFYITTSINWYTSVFTLTAMSADRYMAVCHPIRAMSYRTPVISRVVCGCVWTLSFFAMLPIVLFTTTQENEYTKLLSCTIIWPANGSIKGEQFFIWYAFLLGFAVPVLLISVFYALVVLRLQHVGPAKRSKNKSKSHRKVTQMVLTVITVYVVCWLPYWLYQIVLNYIDLPFWSRYLFQFITIMSYANSMMNPVLYAFLSDNFRKSFAKAFACATDSEMNTALNAEQSCAVSAGRRKNNHITASTALTTTSMVNKSKWRKDEEDIDEFGPEELQALAGSVNNHNNYVTSSTTKTDENKQPSRVVITGNGLDGGGGVYIGPPVDEQQITEKTRLKSDTNNITVL